VTSREHISEPDTCYTKLDDKMDANTKGEEMEAICKFIKWIRSLQDLPCLDGELYRHFVNQPQYTAYKGLASSPAKEWPTGNLADIEQGCPMQSDPITDTTFMTSKGDATAPIACYTYPEDRLNVGPRADLRTSRQPLHISDEIPEAPPAEPAPRDYMKALTTNKVTPTPHVYHDPPQGNLVTQKDNKSRHTPGTLAGHPRRDTQTQQDANPRGKIQNTQSHVTISKAAQASSLPDMRAENRGAAGCDWDEEAEDKEGKESEYTDLDPYQGDPADILLLTPTGESVLWQDVKWERNPHAETNQGSSKLMVIVPGHRLLKASIIAVDLCASMETNFYSQFYKLDPTLEAITPRWSQVETRKTRPATRPHAMDKKHDEVNDKESPLVNEKDSPTPTSRPTQNSQQGKNLEEDAGNKEERANGPAETPIAEPLRDTCLFYSNGQPKPVLGRQPIDAPICRRRVCQGKKVRKGKGKGRRKFRGSASRCLRELVFRYGGRHSPSEINAADLPSALHGDPTPSTRPNPSRSLNKDSNPIHITLRPHTTAEDTNDTHQNRGIAGNTSPS